MRDVLHIALLGLREGGCQLKSQGPEHVISPLCLFEDFKEGYSNTTIKRALYLSTSPISITSYLI